MWPVAIILGQMQSTVSPSGSWELVRNKDSCMPPHTCWTRNTTVRPAVCSGRLCRWLSYTSGRTPHPQSSWISRFGIGSENFCFPNKFPGWCSEAGLQITLRRWCRRWITSLWGPLVPENAFCACHITNIFTSPNVPYVLHESLSSYLLMGS